MSQAEENMVELRVARDPRSEILGRVAQARSRLRTDERVLLDDLAHSYKLKLSTLIVAETDHAKSRAGLQRLLELLEPEAPPAPVDIAELGGVEVEGTSVEGVSPAGEAPSASGLDPACHASTGVPLPEPIVTTVRGGQVGTARRNTMAGRRFA